MWILRSVPLVFVFLNAIFTYSLMFTINYSTNLIYSRKSFFTFHVRSYCDDLISHLTGFKLDANKLSNLGLFNQPFDNPD